MLAYSLTPFITFPEQKLTLPLFGINFSFQYTFFTIVSILVSAMAAVGTGYLLQTHPRFQDRRFWQHSILPALTAWAIGIPLKDIPVSLQWWSVFFFGAAILILVFVSEFIILDPEDSRFPPAAVAITALSFALFFLLTVGARSSQTRLYLLLPILVIPSFLIVLRTLYLRQGNQWHIQWSAAIALFLAGLILGMHYLPLIPVSFGFILLGLGYGITSLAGSFIAEFRGRWFWVEPVLMISIFIGLAAIFA